MLDTHDGLLWYEPAANLVWDEPASRDLGSIELWRRSLARSRHRRELAALSRKHSPRRKGATLALSAAMATTPVVPTLIGASSASAQTVTKKVKPKTPHRPALLKFGSTGPEVVALQEKLHITADGIYGPKTRAAVRAFQRRANLPVSGEVDLITWLALFHSEMTISLGQGASAASLTISARSVSYQLPAASDQASSDNGGAISSAPGNGADHAGGSSSDSNGSSDSAISSPSSDVTTTGSGSGGAGMPTPHVTTSTPKTSAPQTITVPLDARGSVEAMIEAMINEANLIDSHHYPYLWGGGHNPSFSGPYDCSGAVSAVLHAAGLVSAPMVSGDFMNWGAPGAGAVTLYASPTHVYMSINGRFFGTSYKNPGGGAGWYNDSARPGFVVVHVPFERMHFGPKVTAHAAVVQHASNGSAGTASATTSGAPAGSSPASGAAASPTGGTAAPAATPVASTGDAGSASAAPSAPSAPASAPSTASTTPAPASTTPAPSPTPTSSSPSSSDAGSAAAPSAPSAPASAPSTASTTPSATASTSDQSGTSSSASSSAAPSSSPTPASGPTAPSAKSTSTSSGSTETSTPSAPAPPAPTGSSGASSGSAGSGSQSSGSGSATPAPSISTSSSASGSGSGH